MEQLRAIIIDDEPAGIKALKNLAAKNNESIRIVAASSHAEEGIRLIEDYKPDVVFLDIHMPEMNGFELLKKLDYRGFKLVFTTAHMEYGVQAVKNRAFEYLLKPIGYEEFGACVAEIITARHTAPEKSDPHVFIEIRVKDGVVYLKQKDIVRLEACGSYTEVYMDNGIKHVGSKSLGDFEVKLDPAVFFRCHKSHIINLHKVQKFVNHDGSYALMGDGSTPDVSKAFKEGLLYRLKTM